MFREIVGVEDNNILYVLHLCIYHKTLRMLLKIFSIIIFNYKLYVPTIIK